MIDHYNKYAIEVFDDKDYFSNSSKNLNDYKHVIRDAKDIYQPAAKYGIIVKEGDTLVSSAIILGSGGATGIYEDSYLIKDSKLLICCADSIYALQIPSLNLIWKCNPDWATCFNIHHFNDDLIVWGETTISRITIDGCIKWQFGGRDIFVTPNGKSTPFKIIGNEILLVDWDGNHYRLNADGQQVD